MSSGGRFAGGVFEKNQCLRHKTFQRWEIFWLSFKRFRYTVRKKQGGMQSTKDKTGNKPKSVGATIRRQQETQFKEVRTGSSKVLQMNSFFKDVTEVLVKWKDFTNRAHFIFIYGPGQSWSHFFLAGELQRGTIVNVGYLLIVWDDPRIRSVPIPVRRPTLLEVKHVHSWLSKAEVSDYVENPQIEPGPELVVSGTFSSLESYSSLKGNSVRPTKNWIQPKPHRSVFLSTRTRSPKLSKIMILMASLPYLNRIMNLSSTRTTLYLVWQHRRKASDLLSIVFGSKLFECSNFEVFTWAWLSRYRLYCYIRSPKNPSPQVQFD